MFIFHNRHPRIFINIRSKLLRDYGRASSRLHHQVSCQSLILSFAPEWVGRCIAAVAHRVKHWSYSALSRSLFIVMCNVLFWIVTFRPSVLTFYYFLSAGSFLLPFYTCSNCSPEIPSLFWNFNTEDNYCGLLCIAVSFVVTRANSSWISRYSLLNYYVSCSSANLWWDCSFAKFSVSLQCYSLWWRARLRLLRPHGSIH